MLTEDAKMKLNALLAAGLLFAAGASAAPPAGKSVEARQAPSCGEWVVNREKSTAMALGNASWLLGFLSGIAIDSGKNILTGNDNAAIYKWMDAYCRNNPLRDVSSGGSALAAELGAKKAAPK